MVEQLGFNRESVLMGKWPVTQYFQIRVSRLEFISTKNGKGVIEDRFWAF